MKHTLRFAQAILAYFGKTFWRARKFDDVIERRRFLVEQVHVDAAVLLEDIGFKIKVIGRENIEPGRNYLVVGNHLSYIDPFVVVSVIPSLFVTSIEMRETPVLGPICRMAGCIFVERRNRTTIEKDIAEMTDSLKAGISVAIYPEGTTSNGREVLPFKKSLLMSAVFAGRDILPIAIRYTALDGKPFTFDIADEIAWYGDKGFAPHFLNLMKMKSVECEVVIMPPIRVTPQSTRNELAHQAHAMIRDTYMAGLR